VNFDICISVLLNDGTETLKLVRKVIGTGCCWRPYMCIFIGNSKTIYILYIVYFYFKLPVWHHFSHWSIL